MLLPSNDIVITIYWSGPGKIHTTLTFTVPSSSSSRMYHSAMLLATLAIYVRRCVIDAPSCAENAVLGIKGSVSPTEHKEVAAAEVFFCVITMLLQCWYRTGLDQKKKTLSRMYHSAMLLATLAAMLLTGAATLSQPRAL